MHAAQLLAVLTCTVDNK